MSEMDVKARIRLAFGRTPGLRLFNNPVGRGWQGKVIANVGGMVTLEAARVVTYGLMPGSSDLIGWQSVTVTPEMVGQRVAIFVSPEVKRARGGTEAEHQERWIAGVNAHGGRAGFVRSEAETAALLGLPWPLR